MAGTADMIKEKLDIADIVRGYVSLSPAGKNLKGLCPFHKEKTPSFIVSPDRQTWHCFGCSEGGDMISFVMKYENIEFLDTLKLLAEKAGIDIRQTANTDERRHKILYDINEVASNFFVDQLAGDMVLAKTALTYLKDRGLTLETIHAFELGFATNTSDGLHRFLLKQGFTITDIERAGLVIKTERGTYWDRFRGRIMFPLHNHFGKVIGFTGRIMPGAEDEKTGKYVNSPETSIFNKSKLLFGFYKTKQAIREEKTAVFVEGQMDFLLAWQDGIKNVVATSGTAVTQEHIKTIKRVADELIIAFDNDDAGHTASEKLIDLAQSADMSVKLISPPQGTAKDPADIVRAQSGKLGEYIAFASPAMEYYFLRYLPKTSSRDMREMKQYLRVVLQKIKQIASPVERAHWVRELAQKTNISETHLADEMNALSDSSNVRSKDIVKKPNEEPRELSRHALVSERLIRLAMTDKAIEKEVGEHLKFLEEEYQQIFPVLSGAIAESALLPARRELMHSISLSASLLNEKTVVSDELQDLIRQAKIEYFRDERERIGVTIKRAEQSGNSEQLQEALKEFDRVSKEIYNV